MCPGPRAWLTKARNHGTALLHPDRHRDPALKQAADSRFQAINHAFEVLSDPQKRVIYDELGEEGLKSELKVGPRGKTAQEVSPIAVHYSPDRVLTDYVRHRS